MTGGLVRGALPSVGLLVVAEVLVLSTWFSSAAVVAALAAETGRPVADLAGLTTATQLGFVAGALGLAVTALPDRLDPRRLVAVAAAVAGAANALLLVVPADGVAALLARAVVGAALAGVYPVGLQIAMGWTVHRRSLLAGLLVGAVTLGSASPHLIALLGGMDGRVTLIATSVLALVGGLLVLVVGLGPEHRTTPTLRAADVARALRHRGLRLAGLGYFGHMWELYAFWAWVGVAAAASAEAAGLDAPTRHGAEVAFVAMAMGGLACAPAGWLADRLGKANVARGAMTASAAAGLLAALCFGGPFWPFALVLVFWGLAIVVDSAPLSALVAEQAPAEARGSVLTLQTALGFLLTAVTVQGLPVIVDLGGWPLAFAILALGPCFGVSVLGRAWPWRGGETES